MPSIESCLSSPKAQRPKVGCFMVSVSCFFFEYKQFFFQCFPGFCFVRGDLLVSMLIQNTFSALLEKGPC